MRVAGMVHDRHKSRELVLSYLVSVAVIAFIAALTSAGLFDRFLVH
jgi:hypothetical protein